MARISGTMINVEEDRPNLFRVWLTGICHLFLHSKREVAAFTAGYQTALRQGPVGPEAMELLQKQRQVVDQMSEALEKYTAATKSTLPRRLPDVDKANFYPGQRILVECIVAEVPEVPTNWPVKIIIDRGQSETIDCSRNVHYSAIKQQLWQIDIEDILATMDEVDYPKGSQEQARYASKVLQAVRNHLRLRYNGQVLTEGEMHHAAVEANIAAHGHGDANLVREPWYGLRSRMATDPQVVMSPKAEA